MLSKKEIQSNRKLFSESDKSMVAAFKVLSEINRYRIFRILAQQPQLSISNIAHILDISLPLASQHIKVLAHADLIQKERGGKNIFPKLEHDNHFVQAIIKTIQLAQK
jgi:DNA-binding transcriptional ArsR family regulator